MQKKRENLYKGEKDNLAEIVAYLERTHTSNAFKTILSGLTNKTKVAVEKLDGNQ